ncbi:MAG: secondary thiamine-phosphate synthase enzyme YjbQ [Desulfonatronovibrionaceae bacterium]
MDSLTVSTSTRQQLVDITREVQDYLNSIQPRDGILTVYCPHTTGAVTINEGADPSVIRDIAVNLEKLIPFHGDYDHAEGNSDAHIKTSLVGPSIMVIVEQGRLMLGTWQKIFLADFDGPRKRKIWLKFISG